MAKLTYLLQFNHTCTTNTIKSPNIDILKALKKRKIFLNDEAATKMVYLVIRDASKK
ncbi:transposase [Vibrio sp. UCD-FRSSP16_30]|uniref:transposase n=1 Tax=unclassified Vibrio TaxID=2614977 RepID=UPI0018D441C5